MYQLVLNHEEVFVLENMARLAAAKKLTNAAAAYADRSGPEPMTAECFVKKTLAAAEAFQGLLAPLKLASMELENGQALAFVDLDLEKFAALKSLVYHQYLPEPEEPSCDALARRIRDAQPALSQRFLGAEARAAEQAAVAGVVLALGPGKGVLQ